MATSSKSSTSTNPYGSCPNAPGCYTADPTKPCPDASGGYGCFECYTPNPSKPCPDASGYYKSKN